MALVTVATFSPQPPIQWASGSTPELRGWYSISYIAGDGSTLVEAGNGQTGQGFYYSWDCSIDGNGLVVIPPITIQSTTDGNSPLSLFTGQLFDNGAPRETIFGFQNNSGQGWSIPSVLAPNCAYSDLWEYNQASVLFYPPPTYWTADQTILYVAAHGGSGASGDSGASGRSGYSGFSGPSGYSGFSSISGYSGFSAASGYSGFSGANPGASGYSGFTGVSGFSGAGAGTSGFSGFSGRSGYSGFTGVSGFTGFSGISGYSGGGGTGTVTVVGAGTLTSTALVTGGGSATAQTPSTTSTLSSGGNMVLVGTLTTGSGGGTGVISPAAGTFASLPASPTQGAIAAITNSNTATWGATIAGGGTNKVLAYFNGVSWTVIGI